MEYVIAAAIVALLIAGFVAFLWINASRRGAQGAAQDPTAHDSEHGGPAGIGPDRTPLGDTAEHAGEQTADGTTVSGQDAERSGGTGRAVQGGYAGTGRIGDPERGTRPESGDGGERGRAPQDDERDDQPASERLANRRR
jgi:hypothetical protein